MALLVEAPMTTTARTCPECREPAIDAAPEYSERALWFCPACGWTEPAEGARRCDGCDDLVGPEEPLCPPCDALCVSCGARRAEARDRRGNDVCGPCAAQEVRCAQ